MPTRIINLKLLSLLVKSVNYVNHLLWRIRYRWHHVPKADVLLLESSI